MKRWPWKKNEKHTEKRPKSGAHTENMSNVRLKLNWIRPLRTMWRTFSGHSDNCISIVRAKKGNFVIWIFGILLYELCTQRFATWQRLTFVECSNQHMSSHAILFLWTIFVHARIVNADVKAKPSYVNRKSSFGWFFSLLILAISVVATKTTNKSNAGKTDSLYDEYPSTDTIRSMRASMCAIFCVRLLVFIQFVNIWLMWQ